MSTNPFTFGNPIKVPARRGILLPPESGGWGGELEAK